MKIDLLKEEKYTNLTNKICTFIKFTGWCRLLERWKEVDGQGSQVTIWHFIIAKRVFIEHSFNSSKPIWEHYYRSVWFICKLYKAC